MPVNSQNNNGSLLMNSCTSNHAANQDSSLSVQNFPYIQLPSVLMSNNSQNGVQFLAPGDGVFPRGGPASSNMLSALSESSALGVCSNSNLIQREQSSQGSCILPAFAIGTYPVFPTNIMPVQRGGRAAQKPISRENQDQLVPDSHPGFANWLELRAQTATSSNEKPNIRQPSLNHNMRQPPLGSPIMRISSLPASCPPLEHSSSTDIEGLHRRAFPFANYPRSPSTITGGCPRPTSPQQGRWNIGRLRQWQEEKNGEANMVEDEKKTQTDLTTYWRGKPASDYKRGSSSKKELSLIKLEKIRHQKECSKLYFDAPVHHAISMNNLNRVRQLLKTSDPNKYHLETGETPMHLACRLGKLEFVKLLRRHPKIDINLTTVSGVKAVSLPGKNAMQLALTSGKSDKDKRDIVNFLGDFKPKEELAVVYLLNQEQERIRNDWDKLKAKIDRLRQENKDLKIKIEELQLEDANVMGARLPRKKPTDTKNLAEVLKIVRELEGDLTAHQQRIWSEKEDEKQCTICAERQKDTVLVPCGHFFCSVCSRQVEICPNCRKRIERRVRTFDSSI